MRTITADISVLRALSRRLKIGSWAGDLCQLICMCSNPHHMNPGKAHDKALRCLHRGHKCLLAARAKSPDMQLLV